MCQTPHQWWIFRKAILITDMVIAMGLGYTAFGFGCYYLASVPTQETYYLLASGIIQGIGASAVFTAWFVGAGFAICYKTLGSGTGDVWAMNTARGAVMLTCAILGVRIILCVVLMNVRSDDYNVEPQRRHELRIRVHYGPT